MVAAIAAHNSRLCKWGFLRVNTRKNPGNKKNPSIQFHHLMHQMQQSVVKSHKYIIIITITKLLRPHFLNFTIRIS